jgi:hypothetical protein
MDRRQFIRGAGFLGLLAFIQACRAFNFERTPVAQLSTSIPTNTPTSLPSLTPTPAATPVSPVASPTPGSTATPTTTPTATPAATPTPTPSPTPYPPGPPSKLGLFITRHDPKVLEIIEKGKPALITTLEVDGNYVKSMKEFSPTSLIVARLHTNPINLDEDPITMAHSLVDQILPLATDPKRMEAIDAWEGYNEPLADTPGRMKRLADLEAERARLLAENGVRAVLGNFATGHPPLELWPEFKPALDAIRQYNGYLGLHEYSAPVMQFMAGSFQLEPEHPDEGDEGWLTLRYRKAYRNFLNPMGYGDLSILITECGVDGLVQPRPGPEDARGWQDFVQTWLENGLRDDPPGVYMDQLIWYDQNLQQDDYVKGAAIFLAASNVGRWTSYDILGERAGRLGDLLQQYLEVHPPAA